MEWRTGDMIDICNATHADGIVFTANAVVLRDGNLCMGSGAAKRVRDYYPKNLASALGAQIHKDAKYSSQPDYYLVGVTYKTNVQDRPFYIFALQVKQHYKGCGYILLATESLKRLADWCKENPDVKLVMNCP